MSGKVLSSCRGVYSLCNRHLQKAYVRRPLIVVIFVVAAALLGSMSTHHMMRNEREKAIFRYSFTSYHGLSKLNDRFNQAVLGLLTLSKLMSFYHPDPSAWPNVTMLGFYDTIPELNKRTPLSDVGFIPIVKPRDLSGYESFMYNYFNYEPAIPEGSGVPAFKRGLYAIDPRNPNVTYLDTTGEALLFNSTAKVLVPTYQFVFSDEDAVSSRLRLHTLSQPLYGSAICQVAEVCSRIYNYADAIRYCSWTTEIRPTTGATIEPVDFDPQVTNFRSGIIQPVYMSSNSSLLVGFVGGGVYWQRILRSSFQGFKDLDCVVTDDTTSFTYHIDEKGATLLGIGDLHDRSADVFQRKITMTTAAMQASGSRPYSVHLYPTLAFLEEELSATPLIVGTGVALIIMLVAVIVLMNDILVSREIDRKTHEMDIKRRFVRFTSHEIRNPLNCVHLGLELLSDELRDVANRIPDTRGSTAGLGPAVSYRFSQTAQSASSSAADAPQSMRATVKSWQDLAADMMHNSESAVDVLNDLLSYDKVEMGTMNLDCCSVTICPLVKKCVNAFQVQARYKGVYLQLLEVPPRLHESYSDLVVIGDPSRLAQIMRNLLSNALKFTAPDGMIEVKVSTDAHNALLEAAIPVASHAHRDLLELPRAGSVQISVTDSGVGLSPEQLSQICSEGVQFNANELQAGQGSGLGLFISKELAAQHGGTLTVASAGLGQGSKFTLELPVFHKVATSATVLHGSHVPYHRPGAAKRVLVVDDADCNRKMLARLLQLRGYVCEQAEDGQRGIELYQALCERREALDLIVMDYEMPVMDGPTATRKLREMGCACLIVGVTGNQFVEDIEYFKLQGADVVLGKPLDMAVFQELVEEADVTNE